MKRVLFFVLPFALALSLAVRADEKEAAKDGEWKVTVGCAHCNFSKESGAKSCAAAAKTADGKVLLLKGEGLAKDWKKNPGDYVVKGKISDDGKSIEVSKMEKAKEEKKKEG